jgi:predicted exporter
VFRITAWFAATAFIVLGLTRLRFDVEVLDLLPSSIPSVAGLKLYQKQFANTRELVLTLQGSSAAETTAAAAALAEKLIQAPELNAEVTWRPPWQDKPQDAAEFLAYAWLNQSNSAVRELADRLAPDQLRQEFTTAREILETSLSPADIAQRSYDPLRLTHIPGQIRGPALDSPHSQNLFSAHDGRFRVMFVQARVPLDDYRACVDWYNRLQTALLNWHRTDPVIRSTEIGFTGQPAFMAEIGGGMERDLIASVSGTVVVIVVLFGLAHRRWFPLLQLLASLALVVLLTLALGGLIFGKLNVVSVGFAAMLLGLSVDYGLVLYQELRLHPEAPPHEVRRAHRPAILWAAATTSSAFFATALGSLPGLTQLGLLVGIGILIAAITMLHLFLPWASASTSKALTTHATFPPAPAPSSKAADALWPSVATLLALGLILSTGFPRVDHGTGALRPADSLAHRTLEKIKSHMGRPQEPAWLILQSSDDATMADRLERAEVILQKEVEAGNLQGFTLPTSFWPRPSRQELNRAILAAVLPSEATLSEIAEQEGFAAPSLAVASAMFRFWSQPALSQGWPANSVADWALHRFSSRTLTNRYALGLLYPPVGQPLSINPADFGETGTHVWLTSWDQLGEVVLERVERDLSFVLPLVAIATLLSLALAFRRTAEVVLSAISVLLSLLILQALMRLFGWSWNLLNFVALPLLIGAGVDYTLHMQMALRRYGGDRTFALKSVGRALLLCGASTMTGFGSLAFCSSAGLASLGRVCATGIAATLFVALLLLPTWWRRWPGRTSSATPQLASRLYRGELWRLGRVFVRTMPDPIVDPTARFVARLYWHLHARRREVTIRNLLPVFDGHRDLARNAARQLYGNFAVKLTDLWRYEAGASIRNHFGQFHGLVHLRNAQAENRGILLVTPHLGNWEFGAPLLAQEGAHPFRTP